MSTRLWPALLLATATAAGAQDTVRVSVRVFADDGARPLAGATIILDGSRGGQTDENGLWNGFAATGSRQFRVRSIGFRPRDTVVVVDATTREVRVALRETVVPLGEIVVTAARREQRLADAVVETEVITSRDLARGPSDIASVLTERTGIQLDGGVPAGAGVQLRGFGSRRVLVLLDGQPLIGRVNGTMDLARLPVSGIERIEIVKGPQSTLYGTDAIGGVINIISRSAPAAGSSAGLSTSAGTLGRFEASGDWASRIGASSVAVDAGISSVDLVPGLGSDAATYSRRGHVGARGGTALDSATRIEWGALGILERQRYQTGQLFHFGDNVQTALRLGVHRERTLGEAQASLSLATFDHLSRAAARDAPASDSGSNDRQRLLQGELSWNGVRGSQAWVAGVAARREWIEADRLSRESPSILGLEPFAEATFALGHVLVTPGARVSWSDRWGQFTAPRLAALFRPRDDVAVRASLGLGYRAPDFKELYLAFVNDAAGYAVYGNPDLRPERSTNVSLGTEWTGSFAYARVTAFHSAYRDFIETRAPDVAGTYTYGNIERGWTRGAEFEGGWVAGGWRFETGAERLQSRDEGTGLPLLGRAPYTVRSSITGSVTPSTRITTRFAYIARTPVSRDEASGQTQYRDAFPQLDFRIARALGMDFEIGAELSNALNRQLGAQWPGFTGRRVAVQLKWRSGAEADR